MNAPLSDRWKRSPSRPLVLGHRGARHVEEENTLEAFELARHEGADGVELDVQSSSDGVPFVVHDLDLARVTGGRDGRAVRSLSSAELSRVRLQRGRKVPRLEQLLEWAKRHAMLLNIELKTHCASRDSVAVDVARLLRRHPALAEQILVSSFHPILLERFRQELAGISTAFLFTVQHKNWLQCPWFSGLNVSALHPDGRCFLSGGSLPWSRNTVINTWTVNAPEHARQLAAEGVNGIISDCPGRILESLRNSDA